MEIEEQRTERVSESNQRLIDTIEGERQDAARFFVCNLHMHSPASDDYGKPSDHQSSPGNCDAEEEELSRSEWVSRAASTDLEVAAITDHNRHTWACEASKCAPDGLTVLPGCEISVRHGVPYNDAVVHLLAIFESGTPPHEIERIFTLNGFRGLEADRRDDYRLDANLAKVVRDIRGSGGICIGAHVDSDAGLRWASKFLSFDLFVLDDEHEKLSVRKNLSPDDQRRLEEIATHLENARFRQQENYLRSLIECGVAAVQIARPEKAEHYGVAHTLPIGGRGPIACILATDGHRLCDAIWTIT